jgi:cytochrome c oxidase cbb3-type subunit 2
MSSEAIATALGSVGILLFAGGALVVAPYLQLDGVPPSPGLEAYSQAEARGRAVYVREGCVYCHSQQPRDPSIAPDGVRGWGRPSVPGDYVYDYPHQLGTMRTGPDLFNVGARLASEDWHLLHLYQPRAVSEGSVMPGYPFLFDHKPHAGPGDRVVEVPERHRREAGVVVARLDALDLVAYLVGLDHTAPVLEALDESD